MEIPMIYIGGNKFYKSLLLLLLHAETQAHTQTKFTLICTSFLVASKRISQMEIDKLNVDASNGRGAETIFQWQFTKQNGQIESAWPWIWITKN